MLPELKHCGQFMDVRLVDMMGDELSVWLLLCIQVVIQIAQPLIDYIAHYQQLQHC
jgi:hypothetical protein